MTRQETIDLFKLKADVVGAKVYECKNATEAFDYLVDICENKDACKLLLPGCEENLSSDAKAVCRTKNGKIIAAPQLDEKLQEILAAKCEEKGFGLIKEGMRDFLAGVDIGVTVATKGIAETGTVLQPSRSEEVRLATMVSEIHAVLLPKSLIVEGSADVEDDMHKAFAEADYTAFITGPSRTADIERTLAIGVHGPLELHIMLLEEDI